MCSRLCNSEALRLSLGNCATVVILPMCPSATHFFLAMKDGDVNLGGFMSFRVYPLGMVKQHKSLKVDSNVSFPPSLGRPYMTIAVEWL